MAGDDLLALGAASQELAYALRYIAVAGSVETVTAHAILLVQFVGKSVHIGIVGHCLMKSGIEHTHLGNVGQKCANSVHTLDVGRVVQGSQVVAGSECLHNLGGEDNGLVELLAAVHHAVTYSIQFLQAIEHSIVASGEHLENPLYTSGVLLDGALHLVLLAVQLYDDAAIWQTNLLNTATCYHALVGHIVERILD